MDAALGRRRRGEAMDGGGQAALSAVFKFSLKTV